MGNCSPRARLAGTCAGASGFLVGRKLPDRVGAWRLLELAEAYDLPYALLVNTELYDYCPQMVAAFSKRGDEIVGHGRTNAERQADLPLEAEKCALLVSSRR